MLSSDLELYGRLMQVGVQTRLIEKIGNYLREKVRGAIAKKGGVSSEKTELAVEYVTSGMFSAYRYWFHSDRKQSLEEFSREVGKLVLSGIAAFLNEYEGKACELNCYRNSRNLFQFTQGIALQLTMK